MIKAYKAGVEDEDGVILGHYENIEKARRVLAEIVKVYRFYKGERYTFGDSQDLIGEYSYGVYEMPKE